ncbi:hypothetical protein [Streptomyces collinus]|uniref:hypothetical protein n=1 Tax=Streptomyces collinus TaxID=42684 RepID=UPI00368A1B27
MDDLVAVSLTEDLFVTLNGRTIIDEPAVVSDGPDGEVLVGHEVEEPARHCLADGHIADPEVVERLLVPVAELISDEKPRVACVLLVLPDPDFKLARSEMHELVKKMWGADTKVVIVPESRMVATGARQPIWDATGVFLNLLTSTRTTSAMYHVGDMIVSHSAAPPGAVPGSSEPLPIEERLGSLIDTTRWVINESGPGFSRSLAERGLTLYSDDKEVSRHRDQIRAELRMSVHVSEKSLKTALRDGIKHYEHHKKDLITKGYLRSSQ